MLSKTLYRVDLKIGTDIYLPFSETQDIYIHMLFITLQIKI